ncbi:Glucan 1,3-beta-glucosidase 2 [Candida viswanathii]|uniref:glucan 1,3-beta-glucosidase n=1 Tax=Candida viswanathii TaxID=5486 RepID=A0A367XTC1_9ASCO|nr:Glucan 1,3-beta-glucosidase 2 [Candida viswanathii]
MASYIRLLLAIGILLLHHVWALNSSVIQTNLTDFQYKGVSIGGWLVLEPYITPTLFNATLLSNETDADLPVDEYHYCEKLGEDEATRRLTEHWESMYNESDFAEIRSYGLNMVRIPVGYWSFEKMDGDPYVSGAQDYLDKAIEWAKNNDLKVLIDLHGVPNTQNGFDNSGLRNLGYPGWQNKTEYIDHTYKVLQQIYEKYGTGTYATDYNDTIIGIEVVNEPFNPDLDKLKDFYIESYNDARDIQIVNNTIFFQEAFQPIGYWDDFIADGELNITSTANGTNRTVTKTADFQNIIIDHHHYEVFSESQIALNVSTHLDNIRNYASSIGNSSTRSIIGEWSAALTDCAHWLNGVGLGSRYEGTAPYTNDRVGSCDEFTRSVGDWTKQQKKDYRRFVEMQLYQYSTNSQGWIFWCWKTENATEWDFRALVKNDIIPQPLDNYKYVKNGVDTSGSTRAGVAWSLVVVQALAFFFI